MSVCYVCKSSDKASVSCSYHLGERKNCPPTGAGVGLVGCAIVLGDDGEY
jgi:hypothetical protein